jgi:hypothetical protein
VQKNLVQLFNSVVRKVGRTNQVIDENDLRERSLNRTQQQTLDAINDEIELSLSEHSWITTQAFDAKLQTAGPPGGPNVSSVSGSTSSGEPERELFIQVTYNWPHGETIPSDPVSITIPQDEYLQVEIDEDPPGRAKKWNLYVGETRDEVFLQDQKISFSESYREEDNGIVTYNGENPPVKNVATYSLYGKDRHPVDYKFVEELTIPSQHRELTYVVNDEWTQFNLYDESPSIPNYFRLKRVDDESRPVIELFPSPKQSYIVHYSYNEQFRGLENPSDHAPIEDQLVILGASMMLLDTDGQDYQMMTQRYSRLLERIKKRNKPTPDDIQYGSGSSRDRRLDPPYFPDRIDV